MRRKPELMQLEMGMSTRRYFPASGTAGLARSLVRGNSRVPWPPPIMTESTLLVLIDCRPVSDTLLRFIKNTEGIFPGKRGIGFRGAHSVVKGPRLVKLDFLSLTHTRKVGYVVRCRGQSSCLESRL